MSLLKAAVAGFAGAAGNLANKYVDDNMARERAAFMAELQRKTAGDIRNDEFAFRTNPDNVQALTDIEQKTVLSRAEAARKAEKANLSDAELQAMKDAQAEKDTQREVRKMSLIEQARSRYAPRSGGGGGGGGGEPTTKFSPEDAYRLKELGGRLKQIDNEVTKAMATAEGWDPARNPGQAALMKQANALRAQQDALLSKYGRRQGGGELADLLGEVERAGADTAAPGAPVAPHAPSKPRPSQSVPMATVTANGMEGMDRRTLAQLAAIKGHVRQEAAKAELARRQQEAAKDELGFASGSAEWGGVR